MRPEPQCVQRLTALLHAFEGLARFPGAVKKACHMLLKSGTCTCRQQRYGHAETQANPAACQPCAKWWG